MIYRQARAARARAIAPGRRRRRRRPAALRPAQRAGVKPSGPPSSSIWAMYCRSRSTSSVTCRSLSMLRTRVSSSTLLTGLLRKSSVPASTARSMSPDSLRAVTIRIMIERVCGIVLELLADFEARQLGHHDVEQDQVGLELRRLFPACRGRRRRWRSRTRRRSNRLPTTRRWERCRRRSGFCSCGRLRTWRVEPARLRKRPTTSAGLSSAAGQSRKPDCSGRGRLALASLSRRRASGAAGTGNCSHSEKISLWISVCKAASPGAFRRLQDPAADRPSFRAGPCRAWSGPACRAECPRDRAACARRRESCSCSP